MKEDYAFLWTCGLYYFYQAMEDKDEDMVGNLQSHLTNSDQCPWTIRLNAAFVMLLSNNAD